MDTCSAQLAALEAAVADLLVMSESDYPLVPFLWPDGATCDAPILAASVAKADQPQEEVALATFFEPFTTLSPEPSDEERETVQRFRQLFELLNTWENPRVYRIGSVEIDTFLVGATQGRTYGLKTRQIET